MSANLYRRQLEGVRKRRVAAEKKAGALRATEAAKRTAAASARAAAARTQSAQTSMTKGRVADQREREAVAAGREAAKWQSNAAGYSGDEAKLQAKLAAAETAERAISDRRREREVRAIEQEAAADRAELVHRIAAAEDGLSGVLSELRAPKPERLRVLMLAASSEGDLRVGREQKRIRAAVETALHRDLVELDVRPSATIADLLDGITKFRPHVVHFSGHSGDDLIEFEAEVDEHHEGIVVSARAFAAAVSATDDPPLLVLLNSCHSASQIDRLVHAVVPFAIGMADEIDDGDAIVYPAQFYAAVANGQSVWAAHQSGRAALSLAGAPGEELPTLASAEGRDPRMAILVQPPSSGALPEGLGSL